MALKDWKKQSRKSNFLTWWNNKTGRLVGVYYQPYKSELKKKNHWVFEVASTTTTLLEKNTESKPQALKYAKAYMRKH